MTAFIRMLALSTALALALAANAEELVSEEYMVSTADAEVALFVRNKRPAAMTTYPPERNASARRYVVIGAGTHMLLLESNRAQLHREVQLFLDEGLPDS